MDVSASFCFERCDRGPVVRVGNRVLEGCTFEKAREAIEGELAQMTDDVAADR